RVVKPAPDARKITNWLIRSARRHATAGAEWCRSCTSGIFRRARDSGLDGWGSSAVGVNVPPDRSGYASASSSLPPRINAGGRLDPAIHRSLTTDTEAEPKNGGNQ